MRLHSSNAKRPKIILANVWSDRNKGDYAITLGTIKCLRKIYPNARVIVMSMFGANEYRFLSSEYKSLRRYVDEVIGGLYPTYFSYGYERMNRIRQRILDAWSFLISLIKLLIISIFASKRVRSRILPTELLNSTLVILVGGNYINSSNMFSAIFYLFRVLYPSFVCTALKKPYAILGHTIWNINDRLSKALLRFVIDNATLVVVREEVSRNILTSNVRVKNKVLVFPDFSFALADEIRIHKTTSQGPLIIGFSIRRWNFPELKYQNNYREAIVGLIKFLRINYNAKILLIPLGSGPLLIERDLSECMEIFKRTKYLGEINIVKTPLDLQDVFKLYSNLDFNIGVRLHSIIFASMCHVPSIVIEYQGHKAIGIAHSLGLHEYYISINNVSGGRLISLFKRLQENSDAIRIVLADSIKSFQHKLHLLEELVNQLLSTYEE